MKAAFVDTNVLIRHLTGDPPEQARRAADLLGRSDRGTLRLTDLIVAEMVFVLESVYRVERSRLAGLMRSLIGLPALSVADRRMLVRALEIYELHHLGFPDAYLVARAEHEEDGSVITFDRGMRRVGTVSVIEPA